MEQALGPCKIVYDVHSAESPKFAPPHDVFSFGGAQYSMSQTVTHELCITLLTFDAKAD